MDIAAAREALAQIVDHDEPKTKTAAKKLVDAANEALGPLREFVDELDGYLVQAEAAVEVLRDAESDEREDAHGELVAAVTDVRDCLVPDISVAGMAAPVAA